MKMATQHIETYRMSKSSSAREVYSDKYQNGGKKKISINLTLHLKKLEK